MSSRHTSVLLHELVDSLGPRHGERAIDGTLGGGGHAHAIGQQLGENGWLLGLDRDADAVSRAEAALANVPCSVTVRVGSFATMHAHARAAGMAAADLVCLDLGYSTDQLEAAGRGFSFNTAEPLQMTYEADPDTDRLTARDVVNIWPEDELATVIHGYGGERHARRIACAIVAARADAPIERSDQLADLVRKAVPARAHRGHLDPATKTFQALRIAVNDELTELESGLVAAREIAAPGARIALIAFHEHEDRLVKQTFRRWQHEGYGSVLTRRPIQPSADEASANPRARSARLRAFTVT